MQAKNYADFPPHKKAHDDFVAKLGSLSTPLSADTIHFAKDWSVVQHVCFFNLEPFGAHSCHMGTAIKHPVSEWVKSSF